MSSEADIRQLVAEIRTSGTGLNRVWASSEPLPKPVPGLVVASAPRRRRLIDRLKWRR